MKSTFVATLLAVSGFAISGFAFANSVNAQSAIVAALYQNPPAPQTEVRYEENLGANSNQIIIAVNTTPEVKAIAENLMFGDSYDRIVTMNSSGNSSEHLACMVNGKGSVDGTVMCGFIDHE
ncbi:hypothetical protein H6F42_15190 [Pseudanabaena sp. FACHB-1998]|uniref:hypothetical protein n=1 Tax=Pseudanabaena sp. FACHB-1998 TaxID=2692858 RepID=UPI001680CE1F|nr:hypothetical protein [Pseudanabaena sp. FACHB-1998]MBD2178261.1 hypothetical protein [Pseudanabaena sp. FACHB-1998]